MNIVDELNNEFSKQKLLYKVGQQPMAELEKYKQIAMGTYSGAYPFTFRQLIRV